MCEGVPKIAVSKVETALNNKDSVSFSEYYNKYVKYNRNLIYKFTKDAITDYMAEWIKPVADDFNQHFSNFETQEEMDSYLKNQYKNIFFSNENDNQTAEYSEFNTLYALRDSKIKCLDAKKELDEIEKEINPIKNRIDNLYKFSDVPRENTVLTPRDAETVQIITELNTLKSRLFVPETFDLSVCSEEDTLHSKLEAKITQLENEINELIKECDS